MKHIKLFEQFLSNENVDETLIVELKTAFSKYSSKLGKDFEKKALSLVQQFLKYSMQTTDSEKEQAKMADELGKSIAAIMKNIAGIGVNESYEYGKEVKMDILNDLIDDYANAGEVSYKDFIIAAKKKRVTLSMKELKQMLDKKSFLDDDQLAFVYFDNKEEMFDFDDPANI